MTDETKPAWVDYVPDDTGPLHVYRGGNFTKIAGTTYDEQVEKARYLTGAMASMDDHTPGSNEVNRDHSDDSRAVRNAERLVACWNVFVGVPTETIAALSAPTPGWLPAATAPKDGRPVVLLIELNRGPSKPPKQIAWVGQYVAVSDSWDDGDTAWDDSEIRIRGWLPLPPINPTT